MAQGKRELLPLTEDLGLVSSTHSQPSVTSVSGDLISSSDLHRHQTYTWSTNMQAKLIKINKLMHPCMYNEINKSF